MVVNTHALAQFHYEVDVCSLINDLVKLHNVRVPQVRKGVDLSVDGHLSLLVLKVLLVVGLYCDQVFRIFMLSPSYDSKRSCTNL